MLTDKKKYRTPFSYRIAWLGGGMILFLFDRVIKGFIHETGFRNSSLAFGIPAPDWVVRLVIPLIVLLFFVLAVRAWKKGSDPFFCPRAIGFTFLAVGAFSNILDRWLYGAVIDYIQIWILPVFNLADGMIILGLVILLKSMPSAKLKV